MQVAFYKGRRTLLDRSIQFFTRSRFSHVELVHPDNPNLFLSSSGLDGGVRYRDIRPLPEHWEIIPLENWYNPSAWEDAEKHIGKKYDFLGIFLSQVIAAKRHSKESWFCSELVAHALGFDDPQVFSPSSLYKRILEMNIAARGGKIKN